MNRTIHTMLSDVFEDSSSEVNNESKRKGERSERIKSEMRFRGLSTISIVFFLCVFLA